MKTRMSVILGIIGLFIFVNTGLVLGENDSTAEVNLPSVLSSQESKDLDVQWVWGEVKNLDAQGKTVTLKYLDYETNEEKEIALTIDSATTYENVKALKDVQLNDALSVDYVTSSGRNIAKNVSLEKPEYTAVTQKSDTGVMSASENIRPSTVAQTPDADMPTPENSQPSAVAQEPEADMPTPGNMQPPNQGEYMQNAETATPQLETAADAEMPYSFVQAP